MRSTWAIIFSFAISGQVFAASLDDGYCEEAAKKQVMFHHNAALEDIGVIQGYYESIEVKYSKKRLDMDNLDETYEYLITGENDEGDWWTTKYTVSYNTWLSASSDGRPATCDFLQMTYFGIVDEGSFHEEEL